MLEWIERKFKSSYVKLLESELERLREENRQLVSSMLISHGMPGIAPPQVPRELHPIKRRSWFDYKRMKEREAARPIPPVAEPAPAKPAPNV